MAKLIRCPAGHVYDSQTHEACPECARAGVAEPATAARTASAAEEDSSQGRGETKRGLPLAWLIGGGAAAAMVVAAAIFMLRPSNAPADPNSDPDFQACLKPSETQREACERAIASGKFSGNALSSLYNNRGVGHQNKNELDAAIADFAEAIKLNGRNVFAFNNRGNAYRRQHKDDSALEDFAKAIEIDAKYVGPYNNRGLLYFDKGDFDRAIADFDQVVRLDANYLRAYWNRGSAYLKKGDRDHAIADYKKALSLNPNDSVRKMIEAELNQATAQPAPQAAASNSAPSSAPAPQAAAPNPAPASAPGPSAQTSTSDPKSDPDYGACEKASGDSSIAACDRAIASGKFAGTDLGPLYRYRAYAKSHGDKPDLDAAIVDYSEAVKLEPNSFIPFVLRGNVYADKGERELAIKDYDRAIELNPRADFYNNRGNALRKTGKTDLAIADLDQAIKLEPNYAIAYWNRGLAYQDKGDKEKAADDYRKALSLNPRENVRKQIEASLKEVAPEAASQPSTQSQGTPPQQSDAANEGTGKDKEPEPPSSKVLKSPEEVLADPDFKACQSMGTSQAADCDRAIASGKFEGPALAALYNNRGQARSLNHDDDGALEDFNKSIELNPNVDAPYNNRGGIYAARNEFDRAIADFDKAIELNATQPIIFHGRGLAYWKKGDLQHAADDYKKALSLNPPGNRKEKYEQELKEIEAGVKASAEPAPPQKESGAPAPSAKVLKSEDEILADPDFKACAMTDNQKIADCDRAIASGKFEGEGLAALYNARGQARYLKQDLDGALDDYTKALEADGTFASSYGNRGLVYIDKKDYDHAIADFDHAIEIDGDKDYHPFDNRGLAYWSKGDPERATSDYKKALSLNPPDKARQAIEKSLKDIEGGAKYPPGAAPAQKQSSADTPNDDKNSALSGLRDGGSGNSSGLPSTTTPPQGQGSSLSLLRPEDSELPSETRPEGQGSPVPAISGRVATTVLPGVYRLKGTDPEGRDYFGTAALTNDGKKFHLIIYNGANTFRGTAQFNDGILKMRYGKNVTVNFKLNSDGSLDGNWGKGGSERLEPVAFTATTDMPLAEGVYSLSGKHANGKLTSGTVKITKEGRNYHVEWRGDDGEYWAGSGKLAHNILLLSAAENRGWAKDNAIAYAVLPDGSLTGLYQSGWGQEKLTPMGATSSADTAPQSTPQAADPKEGRR